MSSSHSIPTTLHAGCVAYLCSHTVPGGTPGDAQHQGHDGAAGVLLVPCCPHTQNVYVFHLNWISIIFLCWQLHPARWHAALRSHGESGGWWTRLLVGTRKWGAWSCSWRRGRTGERLETGLVTSRGRAAAGPARGPRCWWRAARCDTATAPPSPAAAWPPPHSPASRPRHWEERSPSPATEHAGTKCPHHTGPAPARPRQRHWRGRL